MSRILTQALLTVITLLAPLALPLYALDMTERLPALVAEAERAAVAELAGDAAYRTAGEAQKKLLRSAAIRRQVVAKTLAELDEMQRKVDREFDVRLAKAFDENDLSIFPAYHKKGLASRFKAEMYLYMAGDRSAYITESYGSAEGVSVNISEFIDSNFKNNIGFEIDIKNILAKISADLREETGVEINRSWLARLGGSIIKLFLC